MIRAHEEPAVLTFEVHGPATMLESPAVHAVADQHIAHGVRVLRFDLRDCTTMDSTFTGTLLALRRQLEPMGGSVRLISPAPRVLELLGEMGLEDFYPIDVDEPLSGPWFEVSTARPPAETLQRRILEAHEELERVPGGAPRFGPVVEQLERESPSPPSNADSRRSGPHLH